MTSNSTNNNSSLASDLARIAILSITLDLSRYVAREILGRRNQSNSTSTSNSYSNDNTTKCHDDKVTHRSIDKSSDSTGNCARKGEDAITNKEKLTASVEYIECWTFLPNRLKRRLSKNARDKSYVGLCCYFLLPPPLLMYGAWSCIHRSNNKVQHNSSPSGIYVSSILTSVGLLWCAFPLLLPLFNSDEPNLDELHNDRPQRNQDLSAENNSTESLGTILSIPSDGPLLVPNSNEEERRPRSDSLQSAISECSVDNQEKIKVPVSNQKYLEIIIHNVSHTDFILGLGLSNNKGLHGDVPIPFPTEFEDTPRKRNTSPHNNNNARNDSEEYIMCRPRFSAFDLFSRRVLSELKGQIENTSVEDCLDSSASASNKHPLYQKILAKPRYERSSKTARYTLVTPRPSDQFMLPIGFNLQRREGMANTAVDLDPCEMQNLRLRGRDIQRVDPSLLGEIPRKTSFSTQQLRTMHSSNAEERLRIKAVFFPLLSILLPRWLGQISDKFGGKEGISKKVVSKPLHSPHVKKVVVLVSGVGTPRNWTHSISGNSTKMCAILMELFIHVLYPDITVVRIHSETNIFRYDENITFATQELMPCIDSYRDAHARSEPYPDEKPIANTASSSEHNPFDPDWRQTVSVAYSLADGSAARTHAIQASLRPYRPQYYHFWQLKTFWHETKITDEDIEVHSFEEMETVPAMAVDQTSKPVAMVVSEMKAFRKCFIETLSNGGRSDLKSFWLRKTKKPVLAVLLVRKPHGKLVLYRGTNMEVSMPTGSLCAERNVIGTALADDPGLKREDLLMVAVLSIQLPHISPPPGPPICRPVISPSAKGKDLPREVEDRLKQHQAQLGEMRHSASTSSFASIAEDGPESSQQTDNEVWETDGLQPLSPLLSPTLGSADETLPSSVSAEVATIAPPNTNETVSIPELNLTRLSEISPSSNMSGQSTPKRRVALYQKKAHNKMGGGMKKQKYSLLVQPLEDMNPLKPCGACNEWLKKIAESNPHFKVLTFTDAKCNGVYVSPCQD